MHSGGPNADQATFWNDDAGRRWVTADADLAAMLEPIHAAVLERAGAVDGERVLDVGCGTGQTTVALARRVGRAGSVRGIDISTPMLARARARAIAEGVDNVEFIDADAQTHALEAERFDLVCSRFGVMFFADPVQAFANLRQATRGDGRLAFVCWRSMLENPWLAAPVMAVAEHIAPPPPPPPGGPGPFAFADRGHVASILERAGWREVGLEPFDTPVRVGADVEAALRFAAEVGPTATPLREAEPGVREVAVAALRRVYEAARTDAGVEFASATWLVTARR